MINLEAEAEVVEIRVSLTPLPLLLKNLIVLHKQRHRPLQSF